MFQLQPTPLDQTYKILILLNSAQRVTLHFKYLLVYFPTKKKAQIKLINNFIKLFIFCFHQTSVNCLRIKFHPKFSKNGCLG